MVANVKCLHIPGRISGVCYNRHVIRSDQIDDLAYLISGRIFFLKFGIYLSGYVTSYPIFSWKTGIRSITKAGYPVFGKAITAE